MLSLLIFDSNSPYKNSVLEYDDRDWMYASFVVTSSGPAVSGSNASLDSSFNNSTTATTTAVLSSKGKLCVANVHVSRVIDLG